MSVSGVPLGVPLGPMGLPTADWMPTPASWLNDSAAASPAWEDNATALAVPLLPTRHISVTTEVVLTVCYAVGIAGNLAALVILVRGGRRAHRNARHSLMLRCLACNDLVALLGMLVMMQAQLRLPTALVRSRCFCGLRVVWRLFGLGSGSVALVMALERWLALTRPFLYQKHITYHVVRRAIFGMWSCVLLLVMLPLFGFGLYYNPESNECARYPKATKPADIAYAYVYFTFGMLLIASILCCNLLVVRRLHRAGQTAWGRVGRVRSRTLTSATYYSDTRPRVLLLLRRGRPRPEDAKDTKEQQPPLIRRFSRNCHRVRALQHSESVDSATHEETAFAKLMGFLCVLFVLCWLPQMMAIPLTQLWPTWPPGRKFARLADFSLLLHFTLDPFVYVLQSCTRRHHHKPQIGSIVSLLVKFCKIALLLCQ
ncbi:prostaglandin E2 receptor EP4 subtype [Thrips palmi]|uniref:Prostaglandin E2 receptor EP4 subtype n=1 Tax=Thrips palmi TaxID=161013 RepID=A0A6P9ACZ0_THRPL|nr:prostaglandin E2 receptor EP4 subtype [Thrips palmi]